MLSTIRHHEIFNPQENDTRIDIVGAGAIGSRVFASLAELGLTNINTYDFDTVEPHNIANQIFNHSDIGSLKVDGLRRWYQNKLGTNPPTTMHFVNEYVDKNTPLAGTVFLLVDSMEQRKAIFNHCLANNPNIYRVIDVRMAATHGNVFMFHPHSDEADRWADSLIDDNDAEVSACGSPFSVGPTAAILANIAVWQYIHAKTNVEAVDPIINIFLKPLAIATNYWN